MTSFAEAEFKPACRAGLVNMARQVLLGRVSHLSDSWLAGVVRRLAPVLAGKPDAEVLVIFGGLCLEVLIVDTFAAGELPCCELTDELDAASAQLMLDCTLAALVPGEEP